MRSRRVGSGAGFALAAGLLASVAVAPGAWAQAARAPSGSAQPGRTAGAQAAGAQTSAAASQQTTGRPAQVLSPAEQALRARAEQFWSFWVAGQRMKALDLVAPDSRDIFLGRPIPPVTSFHFDKIVGQDKPGLAVVYVFSVRPSPTPQFRGSIESYLPTVWKQFDGQWYLTMRDEAVVSTPFGPQKLNGDQKDQIAAQQQLQKMIDAKSKQLDMKKIEEYIKTHNRVVSTSPNVQVKFAGDDQSQSPKDKKAQTPPTGGKKPAAAACPPTAGDKTSAACPPH